MFKNMGLKARTPNCFVASNLNIIVFLLVGFKPTTKVFILSPAPCSLTPTPCFGKGQDINYQGASGNVDVDANGDVVGVYDVWTVKDDGTLGTIGKVSPK